MFYYSIVLRDGDSNIDQVMSCCPKEIEDSSAFFGCVGVIGVTGVEEFESGDGGNKLDHLSIKNDISALDVDKRDNTKNENNRSEANSSKHDFKNLLTAKR